ncbi:MAG: hypothetical protein ACYC0X_07670 [Pirellulaceae bacterium]
MKRTIFGLLILAALYGLPASAQEGDGRAKVLARPAAEGRVSLGAAAIEQAAAAQKYIFVLFWKEKNQQTDRTWSVLQPAAAKMANWAEITAVQVTDPAEQELVARYDLSRAPLPLVMAIAPCGAITKAFTGQLTEAQLETAYVSPCTQLCLKALQDKKLVLLCVTDQPGTNGATDVPQGARDFKADKQYGAATQIVLINANDEGETKFLQELQVNTTMPKPCTVLLAPPGTVIGQFDTHASKQHIVAKLVAAQNNPCAGGKCGPNGCGPQK